MTKYNSFGSNIVIPQKWSVDKAKIRKVDHDPYNNNAYQNQLDKQGYARTTNKNQWNANCNEIATGETENIQLFK